MAESARLLAMLRASIVYKTDADKPTHHHNYKVTATARKPITVAILEETVHGIDHALLRPNQPSKTELKQGLDHVFELLYQHLPLNPVSAPITNSCEHKPANIAIPRDIGHVITACKPTTTRSTISLPFSPPPSIMAGRFPALSTSDLPRASAEEQSATASPARGTAMLNSIFKSVRVPEFRFKWHFWAEKGQAQSGPAAKAGSTAAGAEDFASRPKPLGDQIVSVKEFYQHFNNIPVDSLKLRGSIHLFHAGVKPVWEDPRNAKGGAWYFKVGKDVAGQFWHEMCLLAVGDILQGAVETKRASFNDEICGITYSVRWNAVQIAVWNRDAENEAGREKLLAVILEKLSGEIRPKKEDSYWYKAHKEHKGFIEQ